MITSTESSRIIEYIRDYEHPKVQPTFIMEKGIAWVPVNVNLIVKHQSAGRMLRMTKQDDVFEKCNHRLHKQFMQRYYTESSVLLNRPSNELLKNQRSRVSDLATVTKSYI